MEGPSNVNHVICTKSQKTKNLILCAETEDVSRHILTSQTICMLGMLDLHGLVMD